FSLGLEFEGKTDDGDFQLEFAPDRLDRLSIEGIARSLRYQYGDEKGIYIPSVNDPEWTIEVEESVPDQRPYVTGAIVRGIELDAKILDSVIQLQEKLHATMGRTRDKGAIGIHDLTMLRGEPLEGAEPREENVEKSIIYRGIEPDGDVFVPLDSDQELTPKEVLTEHSTGQEYADLVDEYDMYPAIYDDIGLFSFPPVINGRRTEVTTDTRDLFIEMTGTDQWTIDKMCTILCYALDARGGTIEEVTVRYPDRELIRPDLSTKEKRLSHERLTNMLGTELDPSTVIDLFERSGLDATYTSSDSIEYTAEIPPYRVDILHPVDLIDDVGRAYGFNTLVPQYPDVNTIGGRTEASRLENAVRTQLVGLGFEDLLNFHLINEAEIFHRMNLSPDANVFGANEPPSITEPYSEDYTIVRTWALPSIMMV
ncbi:MAG: phenylalanine--tRNA ligase subunit beta, partial [Halobacteriaceae archaeon]